MHRFATQKADKSLIEQLVARLDDIIERFKVPSDAIRTRTHTDATMEFKAFPSGE